MDLSGPTSVNLPQACSDLAAVARTTPYLVCGFLFALGWFVRELASSLILIAAAAGHDVREIARVWVYRNLKRRT